MDKRIINIKQFKFMLTINLLTFIPKNKKFRKILYKLYYFYFLRRIAHLRNMIILFKEKGEEIMGLLFRRNLQLTLLDTLNAINGAAYASEIQSLIPTIEGEKEPSLGAVVMTLSRLERKGLISIIYINENKHSLKNNQRRKYTITLAGKVELNKYSRSSVLSPKEENHLIPEIKNATGAIPAK